MKELKHLDLEKVGKREVEEWLRVARLQGQWTMAKSLQKQAELLGTTGSLLDQFNVAIKRIESQLPSPDESNPTNE